MFKPPSNAIWTAFPLQKISLLNWSQSICFRNMLKCILTLRYGFIITQINKMITQLLSFWFRLSNDVQQKTFISPKAWISAAETRVTFLGRTVNKLADFFCATHGRGKNRPCIKMRKKQTSFVMVKWLFFSLLS